MIVPGQKVEIKTRRHDVVSWYISKGYDAEINTTFEVNAEDLSRGSSKNVLVECDYCHKHYEIPFRVYVKNVLDCDVQKCACSNCGHIKQEELCFMHHGVKNLSQTSEATEKRRQTCLERYGVDNVFKLEEVREKAAQASIEKYGYRTVFQSPEFQEKIKGIRMERYGVEYLFQSKDIREKMQKTFVEKYGGISPMSSSTVRDKRKAVCLEKYGAEEPLSVDEILSKSSKSRFLNGTCKVSREQQRIADLFDGVLNYPVGRYNVDVLIGSNIVIEYDGGAHAIDVQHGRMTKEDFRDREKQRNEYILQRGYRIVRFVNTEENIISDDEYIQAFEYCMNVLDKKDYVEFDFAMRQSAR